MIKKCIGCGIPLQTENENDLGYTPKLENDLCARCFKLKHYGNKIDEGKNQNNTILKVGDKIKTTIIKFNPDDRRISLSIKND